MKTKKELNKCNPGFRDGYNKAKEDVLGLIDANQKINEQLYKDNFITREQFKSYNGALAELKKRING